MLERATAYAEPGINFWLRRVDKPTRTTRALHPSFWRHGVGDESAPRWWPAYLQDIRDIKFNHPRAGSLPVTACDGFGDKSTGSGHARSLRATQRQNRNVVNITRDKAQTLGRGHRPFSVSHRRPVGSQRQSDENRGCDAEELVQSHLSQDEDRMIEDTRSNEGTSQESTTHTGGPVNVPLATDARRPDAQPILESLGALLRSGDLDQSSQVWRLFIRLSDPAKAAGEVLNYLATSHHPIDLDRAIRAYKLMSVSETNSSHYLAAMTAACGRKNKALALDIQKEAMGRSFHAETTNILLAFLIRNSFWKAAANVWDQLPSPEQNAADPRNRNMWDQCDRHTELPEELLRLMRQLEHNSAVYADRRSQLSRFCVQLLHRVFSSSQIMAQITASGTLALLDVFFEAGLLRCDHYFSAIRTLNRIAGSRNRHQLATLLYRNMDMRFPRFRLAPSLLGSLISILCGSDGDHSASRVVLRRFANDWGKPDKMAYQKVLSACAEHGDPKQLQDVFNDYCRDHGLPTSLAFVTPLLYVQARLGKVAETEEQFSRLESHFRFTPDTYCWNILITAHARARDHEGAFKKYRNMRQAGVKPDQYTFGILMGLCARSGDTEAIHELIEVAKKNKIAGTTAMVDSLVHSYCLNDQIEDAENLAETATAMQITGSHTRMWNILLRHYAFRADTDALLRLQDRMKALSVAADDMTYAALMQLLVNVGKTADAANILRALHLSNNVTATIFHYSIVLYGYASEDNRDMVAVIYGEMLERFPQISPSARLSRLQTHLTREQVTSRLKVVQALQGRPMSRGSRLTKTLDFLAQILLEVDQSQLAKKDPQPGLGRRATSEAFPSVYFEFLIAALARSGALAEAEGLFDKYQAVASAAGSGDVAGAPSIRILSAVMMALVQQRRFPTVEKYWSKALSLAIERGQKRTIDLSDHVQDASPGPPKPVLSEAGSISLQEPTSVSPGPPRSSFRHEDATKILPAHRYGLAGPLSHYMHSLADQNLAADLPALVSKLENMGFVLTSKNWNQLIQIFAYSNSPELQFLAFRVFEGKLLPNMPPWKILRRGKWLKPTTAPDSMEAVREEPVQRTFIERFRPTIHAPTYWTMVYLGLALMKAQYRTFKGENSGLPQLRGQSPSTVEAVSKMPYLKERAQGLLLRGRDLRGDFEKRPRRTSEADRAGLRGSRSPLDHAPLQYFRKEPFFSHQGKAVLDKQAQPEEESSLQIAEEISGEIMRRPLVLDAAGRYEHEGEFSRRMEAERKAKLRVAEEVHQDATEPRVLANDKLGEPYTEAKLQGHRPISTRRISESEPTDQQGPLSTAVGHSARSMRRIRVSTESKDLSDTRPAAIISAALQPKDAARLSLLRKGIWKPQALPLAISEFGRSLSRKIVQGLTTYQPTRRIPNRLLRGFTKNRVTRRTIKRDRIGGR